VINEDEIFQENLLKTMLQIEDTFFDLAETTDRNCLVICDRGAMDASAFISRDKWERILARNGLDEVEIRDNRYNQVQLYPVNLKAEIFVNYASIFEAIKWGITVNYFTLDQVLHVMSAARGAEQFYTIEHHSSRSEGLEMARYLDIKAAEAWVGHPYVDLVDNAQDFESKINQLIGKVKKMFLNYFTT